MVGRSTQHVERIGEFALGVLVADAAGGFQTARVIGSRGVGVFEAFRCPTRLKITGDVIGIQLHQALKLFYSSGGVAGAHQLHAEHEAQTAIGGRLFHHGFERIESRHIHKTSLSSPMQRVRNANLSAMDGRPVRESLSEIAEFALPIYANPLGNILGGRIMHLVDLAAATAAIRHSRSTVVTASIDSMSFLHPIKIGQLIILKSSVNRVFRTSMEVGVKVLVEDLKHGIVYHTNSSYVTFVALDEDGKPKPVQPAIPETDDEKRRWREADARRARRLASKRVALEHDAEHDAEHESQNG